MTPQLPIRELPTSIIPELRPKRLEDIPQGRLLRSAAKLFMMGALVWDYAETVCDIAAQMRISETKKLSRAVKQLHADYDRFRKRSLGQKYMDKENSLALLFEEYCDRHFTALGYSVDADKTVADIRADYRMLIKAVYFAMAVIETMKLYARETDEWIASFGVDGESVLCKHFSRLAVILPQFAGDAYNKELEGCKLTARILLDELKQIEVYDENGKV